MKLLLPSVLLLFLGGAARDKVELVYAPEEGTVLKRVFDAKADYHLAGARMTVDDESQEPDELPDAKQGFTEHIAVTDHVKAVADGRPRELVRTFDELGQESYRSEDDTESSDSSVSPLEGRSVRFTWDGEKDSFQVTADDKKELDEALADELLEDMDLRLVLPSKKVAEGDEWDVDPKLYLAFMWPSGLLDFHVKGEEPSAAAREDSHQTIEHLAGSGKAKLEEVREEDGVKVAVIHVELSIQTGTQHDFEAEEKGENAHPAFKVASQIEREVSGTILWDLEHGHARSAELDCTATRTDTRSWTARDPRDDSEVPVETSEELEGTIHYSAKIERQ